MSCQHARITFAPAFAVQGDWRMARFEGHCADCGAKTVFEPRPSLNLAGDELQIPFRMGPPDRANIPKERIALPPGKPILIGGDKQDLN